MRQTEVNLDGWCEGGLGNLDGWCEGGIGQQRLCDNERKIGKSGKHWYVCN